MKLLKASGLVLSVMAGLSLSGCSVTNNSTSVAASTEMSAPLSLEQIYKDKYFKAQRSTAHTLNG
jgi:dipeptidyl-peptidase-4